MAQPVCRFMKQYANELSSKQVGDSQCGPSQEFTTEHTEVTEAGAISLRALGDLSGECQ